MTNARQFVRDYINHNCIARVPQGSKEMLSYDRKGFYTWQFYLRAALFEPRILHVLTEDFFARFPRELLSLVQLAGVESASTPLLTAFALRAASLGISMNVFSIRKKQKSYGKRNWLEGRVLPNKATLVIDDLTSNNHKTMIHAMRILDKHNIPRVPLVYAVVYKSWTPDVPIVMGNASYHVDHVFSLEDFDLTLEDYQRAMKQQHAAA